MTISTENSRIEYSGNGVTTVFSFPYRFFVDSDVVVSLVNNATNVSTIQTLTTHYTLTGAGGPSGGNVTMLTAPTSGETLVIYRDVPITQETDYITGDPFPAETHETALDRGITVSQQLQSQIDRSLRVSQSAAGTVDEMGALEAGQYIRVKSTADGFEYVSGTNVNQAALVETITLTSGQTLVQFTNDISTASFYIIGEDADNGRILEGVDFSIDTANKRITLTNSYPAGTRVSMAYYDASADVVNVNAGGVSFTQSGTGAVSSTVQTKLQERISVKDFGAVGDGVTDDTAAIQAAIDAANARDGRCEVNLSGDKYRVTDELFIYTDVVLKDGTLNFDASTNDKACINIGKQDGSILVRVGGCDNVVVETSSTNTGLIAFNYGHGARACFINNCRAVMNSGNPVTVDRNHIGFSFYGVKADLATIPGAYQNTMINCSAYACKTAYRLDTDGFGLSGYAPEMNGNTITACAAYSCYTNALYIGEGAQENTIQIRADTFVSQIGGGTTIRVAEIRGSFNTVNIEEEIGTRGDTQYSVSFAGANPVYNYVRYKTQQIVTDDVEDTTTGVAVGKNVAENIGRPITVDGGYTFAISGQVSAGAGTTSIYDEVIIPSKAVLIKVCGKANLTPASYTRLYFAKNGSVDTVQRLVWDNTDAPNTIKTLNNDPSASTPIDSRFIYAENDTIPIRVDQDATAGNTVSYTLFFKILDR